MGVSSCFLPSARSPRHVAKQNSLACRAPPLVQGKLIHALSAHVQPQATNAGGTPPCHPALAHFGLVPAGAGLSSLSLTREGGPAGARDVWGPQVRAAEGHELTPAAGGVQPAPRSEAGVVLCPVSKMRSVLEGQATRGAALARRREQLRAAGLYMCLCVCVGVL